MELHIKAKRVLNIFSVVFMNLTDDEISVNELVFTRRSNVGFFKKVPAVS